MWKVQKNNGNNCKKYYENLLDIKFIIELIYMNNVEIKKAIESFEKCIVEKEGKFKGINSYHSNIT